MKIDGWQFTDFPRQYDLVDYDDAKREVKEKLEKIEDISAVYQTGGIAYPGISDIDFLVLFSSSAKICTIPYEPSYSDKVKYLMRHKVLVIPEKLYSDYFLLDPLLRYVYRDGGDQISLFHRTEIYKAKLDLSHEDWQMLDMFQIWEKLNYRLLDIHHKKSKILPVRTTLIALKGVEYTMSIIERYQVDSTNTLNDHKTFVRRLDELNTQWFILPQYKALQELLKLYIEALVISHKAVFILGNYFSKQSTLLHDNDLKITKSPNRLGFSGSRNIIVNSYGVHYFFSSSVKSYQQSKRLTEELSTEVNVPLIYRKKVLNLPILVLPLNFAIPFMTIAAKQGIFSNELKSNIQCNFSSIKIANSSILEKRIELINKIINNHFVMGMQRSDGKYYLPLNNILKYKFGRERWRRKAAVSILNYVFKKQMRGMSKKRSMI